MDFGCGSKPYRELFFVDKYVGVDIENEGHSHKDEKIDVYYNGVTLPFADQEFDSVLCSEVLEHVFNIEEIVKELSRVMKTDGHILITCPFVWNEHEAPNDFARYTRFALESILKKAGFSIIVFNKSGNFIETIIQLWLLYWYTQFHRKCKNYRLIRWFFKGFLVLPSNVAGIVLSRVLPFNNSLYLNNVILAKKAVSIEK